jgi:hypothetical protein
VPGQAVALVIGLTLALGIIPFVVWLVGQFDGWGTLARHYRHTGPFEGTLRAWRSGHLGLSNYSCILTIGTNAEGLYLAVVWLLRPGHPPLFVPWADVSVAVVRGWFSRYAEFRFARAPSVCLRVSERLGDQIAADANRSWAEPGPDVK